MEGEAFMGEEKMLQIVKRIRKEEDGEGKQEEEKTWGMVLREREGLKRERNAKNGGEGGGSIRAVSRSK